MDLGTIDLRADADSGAFCHFVDPRDGSELWDGDIAVGVYIKGFHSQASRDMMAKIERRKMSQQRRRKPLSLAEIDQENAEFLSEITTGWQGASFDGESEFSKELIKSFYAQRPWFAQQANDFAADAANFTKASLTA